MTLRLDSSFTPLSAGGDFVKGDGTGRVSIYGDHFDDEPQGLRMRHAGPGILSMVSVARYGLACSLLCPRILLHEIDQRSLTRHWHPSSSRPTRGLIQTDASFSSRVPRQVGPRAVHANHRYVFVVRMRALIFQSTARSYRLA